MAAPLFAIRDLRVDFVGPEGTIAAVRGVDFDVAPGEKRRDRRRVWLG